MKYILLEDLVPAYFKILVTFPTNLTEYSRRSIKGTQNECIQNSFINKTDPKNFNIYFPGPKKS